MAKRVMDVVASAAGLVALAPLLGVVAGCIRITMGSPVLFRQQRAGLGGQPFDLLKFRTMRHPRSGEEGPGYDAARLTRLGRWLRATSIDELPALWNVLRGDMSLVGPRPLLVKYLERYTPRQARRHEVKPGITGWAQINGRNALGWEERFALDVEYVEHRSLLWDLEILARTVWKVLRAEGIAQRDHATMPEFAGGRTAGGQQRKGMGLSTSGLPILIYGAGGFAREVAWLVQSASAAGRVYDVVGFIDDDPVTHGTLLNRIPVMSLDAALERFPHAKVVGGVGKPKTRQVLMEKAGKSGFEFETIIHPRVERSDWIEIGAGAVICAGSILTTNIILGQHVQINMDCTVAHDVVIGDYATLAPGVHISGCVHVGERAYIGTGAVVINGTKGEPIVIGDDVVVGAGACVTKSVSAGLTVVGIPAKFVS